MYVSLCSLSVTAALVSGHVVRSAGNQSPTDMIVSAMCHRVNEEGATFPIPLIHNKTTLLLFPWRIKCIKAEIGGKGGAAA